MRFRALGPQPWVWLVWLGVVQISYIPWPWDEIHRQLLGSRVPQLQLREGARKGAKVAVMLVSALAMLTCSNACGTNWVALEVVLVALCAPMLGCTGILWGFSVV